MPVTPRCQARTRIPRRGPALIEIQQSGLGGPQAGTSRSARHPPTLIKEARGDTIPAASLTRAERLRLAGAAVIGVEAGKVISTYKTGKHFELAITDTSLTVTRRQDRIDAEAALDGFYVLRTPVPAAQLDTPAVVAAYKNLAGVERDFRPIKSDDLDLRPVFCRLEERVKAHVLICMLACYLTWHLRKAWTR